MINRDADENGWVSSAQAWIDRAGTSGDFSRLHVLDAPMLARIKAATPATALDVGCGEGRFCRMMAEQGIVTTGLDPVPQMIETARQRDRQGDYQLGFAEAIPHPEAAFDLVVSYLSLIDIDDAAQAISEMARVLTPGGRLLIANLTSFSTSSNLFGRRTCATTGEELRPLGNYLETRKGWFEWDGMRVQNWHRPLSYYMQAALGAGLSLTHFDEPQPQSGPPERIEAYQKMPYLMMMEWQKPG